MWEVWEGKAMRRTGNEALYSRIVAMDVKAKERELVEKEVNKFFCEGGAIKCPVCDCQETKKESAAELCARLGYEMPSEEQKRRNLEENLDYFFSQVGSE